MDKPSLVVAGQNINIIAPLAARDHLNATFGINIPKPVKGIKSASLKVQALALGVTEADYKEAVAVLKTQQSEHFVKSRQVVSLLVSDPSIRTSVKQSFRKKDGACIGATATFRKEASVNQSMAAELAQLRAEVARLRGLPAVTA